MKSSLIILCFFIFGIIFGMYPNSPSILQNSLISEYALYLLMFLLGIGIGSNRKTWTTFQRINIKIILVPASIVIGSLLGTGICSFFLKTVSLKEALSIGAGFGYYSMTSMIVTQYHGASMGVVALIANMTREITTLLFAPLLVQYFGQLAPIASGGATSMATTLPIISKSVGKQFAFIAVFSGIVLALLVPILVTFFIK